MTYHYYGVKGDFAWKLAVDNKLRSTNINHVPRLMRESNQVWCQGPRGGVKIVKDRTRLASFGYVTNNAAMMKKFAWVKLSARPLGIG